MGNKLKKILLVLYAISVYAVCSPFYLTILYVIILYILAIVILFKKKLLYFSIFIKLLIFDIFLLSSSMFTSVVLDLSIGYSFGGSLFSATSLFEFLSIDKNSLEAKILLITFALILSVIILFTIVKPFINHLDKSIRKIKAKENINKENKR
jgi:hypothetical protein